jgi:hypothetical protein
VRVSANFEHRFVSPHRARAVALPLQWQSARRIVSRRANAEVLAKLLVWPSPFSLQIVRTAANRFGCSRPLGRLSERRKVRLVRSVARLCYRRSRPRHMQSGSHFLLSRPMCLVASSESRLVRRSSLQRSLCHFSQASTLKLRPNPSSSGRAFGTPLKSNVKRHEFDRHSSRREVP